MHTAEVCKKLDITPKSLRVYEEKGLIVPKREKNEYRNYSELDLLKLRALLLLKDLGFSLQGIKKLLDKNMEEEHAFIRSLYIQKQAIQKRLQGLKNYVEGKMLKFRYKHLVNFTWLIVIEK